MAITKATAPKLATAPGALKLATAPNAPKLAAAPNPTKLAAAPGAPMSATAPKLTTTPGAPKLATAPKLAATPALSAKAVAAAARAAARGMTGNEYRDLIASYIHHNYALYGLVVYVEISLGKTVIGKDRCIDVFVVRPEDRKAIAIECKYQDSLGTVDEKIPYALLDLEALWVPGCLVYAGSGWSKGVLHSLEASHLAANCLPDKATLNRTKQTRELDHMLAATFGLWDLVLPANKRFRPQGTV